MSENIGGPGAKPPENFYHSCSNNIEKCLNLGGNGFKGYSSLQKKANEQRGGQNECQKFARHDCSCS